MFRKKGWKPVDAEYAYKDEVYGPAAEVLPAGESLILGIGQGERKFENELFGIRARMTCMRILNGCAQTVIVTIL